MKKSPHTSRNEKLSSTHSAASRMNKDEINEYTAAAVVESSEHAIYSNDFDGTILSWNEAAQKIFDYSAREIIGQNVSLLCPPEKLFEESDFLEQIKRGKRITSYETIRTRKDAIPVRVCLTVSPIKNADDNIFGVLKIARELKERRRTQRTAGKNSLINRRLSEIEVIYRTAPIGLACLDKNLRYLRINDHLAEINGIVPKTRIGLTLREALPKNIADEVESLCQIVLATGEPIFNQEVIGENATQPGIKRTRLVNYYPLTDEAGGVVGVNVAVQDITGRKQAEEKLRQSEERLRGLINNLFSFVGLLNPDGTLTEINHTALAAANLEKKAVIGKRLPDAFWWSWSKDIQEQIEAAIKTAARGETVRHDLITRIGKNQFTTIDFQLAPMFDENGALTNLVLSAIDISERLRLEAELKQAAQISLAGELAASLAHEIKNPLAGIQGAIDFLISCRDYEEEDRSILENVRSEVVRIDDAVRSLLNQMRPRPASFAYSSLNETVRRAVRLANHQLVAQQSKNRIEIETDLPQTTFLLTHDAAQIEDAVLNLLINATDAIGEKTGRIDVRLFRQEKAESPPSVAEMVIEVSDTGTGISESDLANLFTPFYTTKKIGTGLGLVAVKRIAEMHGGRCALVESVVGKGSTFAIYLPINSHL